MANVRVELTSKAAGDKARADILDTPGPINKWKSLSPGAWGVERGDFTNILGKGNAAGGGVFVSWQLSGFDIDAVAAGSSGEGVNNDAGGSFPPGDITWLVLKVF